MLPTNLASLIKTILSDNCITSWRIQDNQSLTLSIRFGSHVDSTGTPIANRYFRSKPPSTIQRDRDRQQVYFDNRDTIDTGYSDKMNVDLSDIVDTKKHEVILENCSTPYDIQYSMRETGSHSAPSNESMHVPTAGDRSGHSGKGALHNVPT